MNVIKRNGKEVIYDDNKIFNAINKASIETSKDNPDLKMNDSEIKEIVSAINYSYRNNCGRDSG